jgi:hypothetical protein
MGSAAPGTEPLFFTIISGAEMRQWNAIDTTSFSFGAHQIKVGVDYRHIASPTTLPSNVEALCFSSQAVLQNSATDLALQKEIPGTRQRERWVTTL